MEKLDLDFEIHTDLILKNNTKEEIIRVINNALDDSGGVDTKFLEFFYIANKYPNKRKIISIRFETKIRIKDLNKTCHRLDKLFFGERIDHLDVIIKKKSGEKLRYNRSRGKECTTILHDENPLGKIIEMRLN